MGRKMQIFTRDLELKVVSEALAEEKMIICHLTTIKTIAFSPVVGQVRLLIIDR
nr:hypothetical protein [uncultured Sphaerochaeta sp.]